MLSNTALMCEKLKYRIYIYPLCSICDVVHGVHKVSRNRPDSALLGKISGHGAGDSGEIVHMITIDCSQSTIISKICILVCKRERL